MERKPDQHRTLQDDRAALDIDAEDPSPLVEGEGAPLADDGVTSQRHARTPVVTHAALGGLPVAAILPTESDHAPRDPIATADDQPIDD
jgi:hypothetical protein